MSGSCCPMQCPECGLVHHNATVEGCLRRQISALTAERDRYRKIFNAAKRSVCDLETKVARLERQLEPLTRDELVEDGEARAYWCGMTVTNVLELTKQIDRIRARRGE